MNWMTSKIPDIHNFSFTKTRNFMAVTAGKVHQLKR